MQGQVCLPSSGCLHNLAGLLHVHKSTHTCLFGPILGLVDSWECLLQDDASRSCTGCSLIQQTLLPPAACRHPCRHHSSYTCRQQSYTHSTTSTHPFALILQVACCTQQDATLKTSHAITRCLLLCQTACCKHVVPAALPAGTASQARTVTVSYTYLTLPTILRVQFSFVADHLIITNQNTLLDPPTVSFNTLSLL